MEDEGREGERREGEEDAEHSPSSKFATTPLVTKFITS